MPSTPQRSYSPSTPHSSPVKTRNPALLNGITKRPRAFRPSFNIAALSTDAKTALLRTNLPGPISELTQFRHIPLVNIAAIVSRSAEIRQAEIYASGARNYGRIGRPSNAFILYRKCYHARFVAYCKQKTGNEQTVSCVSGLSWKLEPVEIRAKFAEWAEQEKKGHAEAWPEYKYAPKKDIHNPVIDNNTIIDNNMINSIITEMPTLNLNINTFTMDMNNMNTNMDTPTTYFNTMDIPTTNTTTLDITLDNSLRTCPPQTYPKQK
ncbi:hypothetical protein N0V88_006197 [Collariella sp. IMI 366227]|nr:hypothetical protein N0V88_006197 [Collariella sp. IMI 366227]